MIHYGVYEYVYYPSINYITLFSIMQHSCEVLNPKKNKYDRFDIYFSKIEIVKDLLLIQYSSFDFSSSTIIDLISKKVIPTEFSSIFISADNKYILSFGDSPVTGMGFRLEFYNGNYIGKDLVIEGYGASNIEYKVKNKEDFILYDECIIGGEDIKRKEINLTEFIKTKT